MHHEREHRAGLSDNRATGLKTVLKVYAPTYRERLE